MSLLKNGFYNALTGLVRAGLVLLTIPILTRLLGIAEYGLWSLVSALVELIVLSGNGISVTTTVFAAQDLARKNPDRYLSQTLTIIAGGVFLLATVSSIGLFCGSQFITYIFPNLAPTQVQTAVYALQISGFVVWSRLIQQVPVGIEQAYQQYGYLNLLNTIQAILLHVGMMVIAASGGKIIELMQWQACLYTLISIGHLWLVRKLLKANLVKLSWDASKAVEIGKHSLTNLFLCIGNVIFGRGDRIVVAYFLTPEILGMYAAITDIAAGMTTLSNLPVQPLISLLGKHSLNESQSQSKFKSQIKQSLELNMTLALGIGAWLFALAPLIVQGLLAKTSSDSNTIVAFRVAIVIYALISINSVGFFTLLALDVNLCTITFVISAFTALSLIVIGAKQFGLIGALAGNVGFFLSWSMLFSGMEKLKLPRWFWLKYSIFPLTWFFCFIGIVMLAGNNLSLSIGISGLETLPLIYWFLREYKDNQRLAAI